MRRGVPQNKKYEGKFVATPSFNSSKVVASGKDPDAVYDRAVDKGYKSPVIVFVPDRKMFCIL
jgi:hypothetical protein